MVMAAKKQHSARYDVINYLGLIAIAVLLNYVLSFFFGRFDLTEDKRHSLSPNTIALLEDESRFIAKDEQKDGGDLLGINVAEEESDPVFFKIYLEGDLPADMMRIRNAIQEKLDEFIVYAGDRIQYEFIDPNGDEDEDFNLAVQTSIYDKGRGILPCDIQVVNSGKQEILTVWPGAVVSHRGMDLDYIQFFNKQVIYAKEDTRGLADQTINNLEYLLISSVRRVTGGEKPTVGFLQGQGELAPVQTADVRMNLSRYYLIKDIAIGGRLNALDELDVLIVAAPTQRFTEKDKFVIDQYIMNGGKVMWFVDPIDVDRDSLYYTGETFGVSANLNIEKDMIYKYGVNLNSDLIVDENCGPLEVPGHPLGIVDWYFYPTLEREPHAITKNLDPIRSEYASSIKIVNEDDKDVKKTVLLKSSYNSRIFKARARVNYSIIDVEPNFNDGSQGNYPVAVLLEGKFSSPFEFKINDAFLSSPDYKTKFKSENTKMLVVADGDVIRNEVVANGEIIRIGRDSLFANPKQAYYPVELRTDVLAVANPNGTPKYSYGNLEFVLNAVDYMLDDHSLLDVRTKTITLRVLDTAKVLEAKEFWRFINIAVPLLIIFGLGGVQFIIRKRRFARS
jgi:ABC-2 type transport system permease protein